MSELPNVTHGNNPLETDPGALSLTFQEDSPHSRTRIGSSDFSSVVSPPLTLFQPIAVPQPLSRYDFNANVFPNPSNNNYAAQNMTSLRSDRLNRLGAGGSGPSSHYPLASDSLSNHPVPAVNHPSFVDSHRPSLTSNPQMHPAQRRHSRRHHNRRCSNSYPQFQPLVWRTSDMSMDSRPNFCPFASTSDEREATANSQSSSRNRRFFADNNDEGSDAQVYLQSDHNNICEARKNSLAFSAFSNHFVVLGDDPHAYRRSSRKSRTSLCSNGLLLSANRTPPSDEGSVEGTNENNNNSHTSTNTAHRHHTEELLKSAESDVGSNDEGPNVLLRTHTLCLNSDPSRLDHPINPAVSGNHMHKNAPRKDVDECLPFKNQSTETTDNFHHQSSSHAREKPLAYFSSHSSCSSSQRTLIPLLSPKSSSNIPSFIKIKKTENDIAHPLHFSSDRNMVTKESKPSSGTVSTFNMFNEERRMNQKLPYFVTMENSSAGEHYTSPLQRTGDGFGAAPNLSSSSLYGTTTQRIQHCKEWLEETSAVRSLSRSAIPGYESEKDADDDASIMEIDFRNCCHHHKDRPSHANHPGVLYDRDADNSPSSPSYKLKQPQHTSPMALAGFLTASSGLGNNKNTTDSASSPVLNFAHSATLSVSNSLALRHYELDATGTVDHE